MLFEEFCYKGKQRDEPWLDGNIRSRKRFCLIFAFHVSHFKSDVPISGGDIGVRRLLVMQNDEQSSQSYEKSVWGPLENPYLQLTHESDGENCFCEHS